MSDDSYVGIPQPEYENTACFACGKDNDEGMHMKLEPHPEGGVFSRITIRPCYQGWHGVAHGGIQATILDEVMAYSVLYECGTGVTAGMKISYKQPVPTGQELLARGWIEGRRGRLIFTKAQITLDGKVMTEAEAKFFLREKPKQSAAQN